MYTIQLKDKKTRDGLQEHLVKNGIMNKIYFEPVHLKTLYKKQYGYKERDLPKTEELSKRTLTLPLYPDLTKENLDFMISTIRRFFEKWKKYLIIKKYL